MASQCHSLKEKRSVVRKLKDRVRARFHVSLSEVGAQDLWQRVVLALAVVSGNRASVEKLMNDIVRFVEQAAVAEVVSDEREVVSYGDGPMGEAVSMMDTDVTDDDWVPASWKTEEVP